MPAQIFFNPGGCSLTVIIPGVALMTVTASQRIQSLRKINSGEGGGSGIHLMSQDVDL